MNVVVGKFLSLLLPRYLSRDVYRCRCPFLQTLAADTYSSVLGQSPLVDDLFGRIWAKVTEEVRLQRELAQVRGALEMVLARSALGAA